MLVVISERAEEDIAAALVYLMALNARAAETLATEVESRIESLSQFPMLGSPRNDLRKGLRCLVVRSLLVFYTLGPDEVLILRVIDGRMDVEAEFRS